jgi:hypothetical protein
VGGYDAKARCLTVPGFTFRPPARLG